MGPARFIQVQQPQRSSDLRYPTHCLLLPFPAPTASWGTVTGFGLWDASTSGNQWFCFTLSTSKTINNGDAAPSFAAGALTITFQ
jgi:hypothetical protein